MKKVNYLLLGAAGLILASCANEDLVSNGLNPDGTANVTLTLSTPQIPSRAYSDGTTAQKLLYAVYEVKEDAGSTKLNLIQSDGYWSGANESKPETIELRKQMTFKLLTDHTYRFVFWAESADDQGNDTNPYVITFEDDKADLTINYTNGVNCNDENLDAFYGGVELKITGNVQMDVPLSRPFAQINVGTNDLEDASDLGYPAENNKILSTIKTKSYTSMSLFDGEISGTQSPVEFSFAEIPSTVDGKFPVPGYDYLAMTYILVPDADDEVVDVTFNYKENGETLNHTRTVGSAPVKRNHRTNIYGQILTSNAELNIHIVPAYNDPDLQPSELEMVAALGGTVVLDDDVEIEGQLNILKDAVIDLSGFTLNTTGGTYGDAISITTGTTVSIKNGTIAPSSSASAENGSATIMLKRANNGKNTTITLEDVTVTGYYPIYDNSGNEGTQIIIKSGTYYPLLENTPAIYVANGTSSSPETTGGKVTIYGGTFGQAGVTYPYLLNVQDKLRKANGKEPRDFIEVYGGTFINFDPSACVSEGFPTNFVANGYIVKVNQIGADTYYTVVPEGNKEAVVQKVGDKVFCLAPALPEGATEEDFANEGGLYVDENGEVQTFAATGNAIAAAMEKTNVIYLAPNSTITTGSHFMKVQQDGITVYGNGATINGGEMDFSVQSWSEKETNYPKYEEGSTIDVNIYDLNNVKVWGGLNQDINLNVYLKNCTMEGTGITDGGHSLIMVRGADEGKSKVSITLEDCYAKNIQVGLHTTYVAKIVVNNCKFEEVGIPVNYAKKLQGENAVVEVLNCEFNKCGIPENTTAWNYSAPIRIVDNAGPHKSTNLKVDNCTFNNTKSLDPDKKGTCDILLVEYRTDDQTRRWYDINYDITNCGDYKLVDTCETLRGE